MIGKSTCALKKKEHEIQKMAEVGECNCDFIHILSLSLSHISCSSFLVFIIISATEKFIILHFVCVCVCPL